MISNSITWLRNNLFYSWYQGLFSILTLFFIYKLAPPCVNWLILKANFIGTGPSACTSGGACWVFVKMRLNQFLYGFYPRDLQWRIDLSYIIAILGIIAFFKAAPHHKKNAIIFLCVIFPSIAFVLYRGGIFGLELVETYSWGGLHLTLVLAVAGMIFAFPLGVLLAVARNYNHLPVIRALSIIFIEINRSIPLLLGLFMASVLLPIFFPIDVRMDKVLRALIGITLFEAAYIAELIRTGIHAIPKGQFEAAHALGFHYTLLMRLIILPQALKRVIPDMLVIFISLFKGTTLVLIIGLFDFLGMIQEANSDPEWVAYSLEGFVFAGMIYWIFCYLMTRYSNHLELKLSIGQAR